MGNVLERLVTFAVQRRSAVLAVSALVAAVAALTLPRLAVDAVPDVTNVQVSILTTAPGLSPSEVEQYITYPVETAMNGLPDMVEVRSVSKTAVSAVTLVFADHVDVWFARQLVSERLKQVESVIPPGYGRPELAPVSTGLGEIYEFYLDSSQHSPMELRTLLDWVVAPRLRSVPGVIEVNSMGGEAKEFQVVLDPKRMASFRLNLRDVLSAVKESSANVGGGYVEKNGEQIVLRGEAQFKDLEDIAATMLSANDDGTPILLVSRCGDPRGVGLALRGGHHARQGRNRRGHGDDAHRAELPGCGGRCEDAARGDRA
ncbi:MAG: efflux RND transporter permease subunit [Myxococcales bacterium]|nr:efflux RND transporter permease subunit [Myxococcales bacterium]